MRNCVLAAGLFALLISPSLLAQTGDMKATIPFNFHVGDTLMPSGDYSVHQSPGVLILHQKSSPYRVALELPIAAQRSGRGGNGELVFNRYGDAYFLSKVWAPDTAQGQALRKTALEKEIARISRPVQTAAVALKVK
jgi:hypothetical protein